MVRLPASKINRLTVVLVLLGMLLHANALQAQIAVIIHPNNPIETLTQQEIKKIFLGQSRLFPRTKQGMNVIDIHSSNPLYQQFYEQFIGFRIHKLQRYRAAYLFSGKGVLPDELPDALTVKNHVSEHIDAIGYIDASLADDSVRVIYLWTKEK